jgi:small subunit ribosomal protein S20
MPNIKSAAKNMRKSTKRRLANRVQRSAIRTAIKKIRVSIGEKNAETAQTLLPQTLGAIDKAARKKKIHKNKAARYASRLTKQVNALNRPAKTSS